MLSVGWHKPRDGNRLYPARKLTARRVSNVTGNWGPGVQALGSLLTGYFRLSRRRSRECLQTLLGYAPCVGTLVALEAATVRALLPAVREAQAAVAGAAVVNADETGWRKGRDRPTLWIRGDPEVALFRIGRRNKDTYEAVLPPLPPGRTASSAAIATSSTTVPKRRAGSCAGPT
jgi:hypothetical protein